MKVYVITKIYGDYEISFDIDSVWDDAFKAESHKVKLIADNELIKNEPAPYEESDYMLGNLSESQDNEYYEWSMRKSRAEEFREPIIEEFELSGYSSTQNNKLVIPPVMEPFCSCSKILGTSKDDFGRKYCLNCGKHVEQNAP